MSRRGWLLTGLGIPVSRVLNAFAEGPELTVTWDGDSLHLSAPRLHFLAGKPLARLRDGLTVVFVSQLSLFTDSSRLTPFRQVVDRLVMSWDLWEDRFKVMRLGHNASSQSRLTAPQAEAWCLDSLTMSAANLAPDQPFWLRFQLRTTDSRELSSVVGEPGISITRLVEIFSRKPGPEEPNWLLDAGPLKLSALARTPARRPRTG